MRRSFLLLLLLAAPGLAAAQLRSELAGGFALSSFRTDGVTAFSPRAGLAGGFGLGYDLRGGFFWQVEALYLVRAARADPIRLRDLEAEARLAYTYIDVPVVVGYVYRRRGRVHPKLFGGLGYGFLQDSKVRLFGADGASVDLADGDAASPDLVLHLGAGADVEAYGERVTGALRLTYGLRDVREQEASLRNVGVLVLVGVGI